MRIVDLETFRAMPAGTVFAKYPEQPLDGSHAVVGTVDPICIKEDTIGELDFGYQELHPNFEDEEDGRDWSTVMRDMLKGITSPPLDYDCADRDALFERRQLFLIWERDDLVRMIARLGTALEEGYTAA